MTENYEDLLMDSLLDIKATTDEFISRRINHINFARTIYWLSVKSRKEAFIYCSELSEFLRLSDSRTRLILDELVKNRLLRKRFPTSNLVEYTFIIKDEMAIIQDYFERAAKTLKIKIKLIKEEK